MRACLFFVLTLLISAQHRCEATMEPSKAVARAVDQVSETSTCNTPPHRPPSCTTLSSARLFVSPSTYTSRPHNGRDRSSTKSASWLHRLKLSSGNAGIRHVQESQRQGAILYYSGCLQLRAASR